jgi:tRNA threonylcarbamoyladenosine biosynthesis protein TsaE
MPETVTTHQREETLSLAARVAEKLASIPRDRAAVVTLRGELGSGKTTFTQGLLGALGVEGVIASPTFMLLHRYPLTGAFSNAYHVDAYRLMKTEELETLGLTEALADPTNLIVVEWPEVGGELFGPTLDVQLSHGSHEGERVITLDWKS